MLEKTVKWLFYCMLPLQCGLGSWAINGHGLFASIALVIDIVYILVTVILEIILNSRRVPPDAESLDSERYFFENAPWRDTDEGHLRHAECEACAASP